MLAKALITQLQPAEVTHPTERPLHDGAGLAQPAAVLLPRLALRRQQRLDPPVWSRDWVVHSQAAGDGRESLRYLATYVFRVAIGDHRIVSCDDGKVTFAYRRVGSNRPRRMMLDAMEFLRRCLHHVLPAGFQKVRHYGFFLPSSTTSIEAVRWLIALGKGVTDGLLEHRLEVRLRRTPSHYGWAASQFIEAATKRETVMRSSDGMGQFFWPETRSIS